MEQNFKMGIKDGIPICLGYISVSFTFGLLAVSAGLNVWQAALISMSNVTSAGQFAGLNLFMENGSLIELFIAEFFINVRYLLMSVSLSQKVDENFKTKSRLLLAMGVTDEIFAVSMSKEKPVSKSYFTGLFLTPYLGWTLGTVLGAILGSIVPSGVAEIFGIAIYGMFIAIIIPKARESAAVLKIIIIAAAISCLFYYLPFINLSSGLSVTICAILSALFGAIFYPIKENA